MEKKRVLVRLHRLQCSEDSSLHRIPFPAMVKFTSKTQHKTCAWSSVSAAAKSRANWIRTTGPVKDSRLFEEFHCMECSGTAKRESFYITESPMVSFKWKGVKMLKDHKGENVLVCQRDSTIIISNLFSFGFQTGSMLRRYHEQAQGAIGQASGFSHHPVDHLE